MRVVFLIVLSSLLFSPAIFAELPELIGTIRSDTDWTEFGKRIVPMGDQNSDGYDDFITWGLDFHLYMYYGGDPADTNYVFRIDSAQNRFNNLGDVNNDGYDDFITGGRKPDNWKLNLFYGGPNADSIRDLWFGNDTLKADGYTVFSNDVNNNGNPEIWSWYTNNSSVVLFELGSDSDSIPDLNLFPPNLITYIDYDGFGEGIIAGDLNGDGLDDLGIGLRYNENDSLNGQVYLYWGGPTFDTIPDMIITRPGEYVRGKENFGITLENLGDINNDGFIDFLAGSGSRFEDTVHFIYFGGPSIDTVPDLTLYEYLLNARLAGDLNSDGYNDLITSYPIYLSGLGHVNIYYGGPEIDNIPDISIHNSDMPEWQQHFGNDCSGIGDYNGDGIDDFAFSAVDVLGHGIIYIFSGTGPSTDVEFDYKPNLPNNFRLSQNYPNPFNPSTTIEFQLPQRAEASLSIYNTLGQKIRTLINKELPTGSYNVEWDCTNESGADVATGVYFYKLETEDLTLSKKMVLLR